MINVELSRECGLFPSDVNEVSLMCVDDDLFCWVLLSHGSEARLIALADAHQEARDQLIATLEAKHGFAPENAAMTVQRLFADAFGGTDSFRDLPVRAGVDLFSAHAGQAPHQASA